LERSVFADRLLSPIVTLAAATRTAVREHPFLREALRAGVVNYTAAARLLAVDGEESAVVAALRRHAETLPPYEEQPHETRVTIESGFGPTEADDPALLRVGSRAFGPDGGSLTGVMATGAVDTGALAHVLACLRAAGIDPDAAGLAGEALLIVVSRSDGPTALRVVESALEAVPVDPTLDE
jgi:hypothetical protein